MYAFKCGDDSKNKLKGISKFQSNYIEFEEFYNCLFGGEYQKGCDIYIIPSINHEMYFQRVKKPTPSQFDVKGCYINETESITWKYYNLMVVKVKEKIEKTRHGKSIDNSKKLVLRGQRNVRYHNKILTSKEESYNFTT